MQNIALNVSMSTSFSSTASQNSIGVWLCYGNKHSLLDPEEMKMVNRALKRNSSLQSEVAFISVLKVQYFAKFILPAFSNNNMWL